MIIHLKWKETVILIQCLIILGCIRSPISPAPEDAKMETFHSVNLEKILPRFQKGIESLEKGRGEEAKSVFEDLRNRYPHVSVFHHNLGVAYKKLGMVDQAIEAYKKAIQLNGTYPEPHYNLGIALREKGEFREAETAYRKSLSLNPEFGEAHFNLAVMYDLYLDRPEEAMAHYQSYLKINNVHHEEIQIWITGLEKRMEENREK